MIYVFWFIPFLFLGIFGWVSYKTQLKFFSEMRRFYFELQISRLNIEKSTTYQCDILDILNKNIGDSSSLKKISENSLQTNVLLTQLLGDIKESRDRIEQKRLEALEKSKTMQDNIMKNFG